MRSQECSKGTDLERARERDVLRELEAEGCWEYAFLILMLKNSWNRFSSLRGSILGAML